MTAETLRERLLGEVGKPICPYDRRHPDYWTTPDDAACKVCGQLPDGPDIVCMVEAGKTCPGCGARGGEACRDGIRRVAVTATVANHEGEG